MQRMSLSDRYNRGGGRIQSFDKYLTHIGNRAGNLWLHETGISRTVLTQGLYVLSALAAAEHYLLSRNPMSILFAGIAIMGYLGAMPALGGVVEQIQAEAAGLPRNALAIMRLQILGVGVFMLATSAGHMAADLAGARPLGIEFLTTLALGISFSALQASDYIRRTNPATPSGGGGGKLHRYNA
jgi:hypothetical protein